VIGSVAPSTGRAVTRNCDAPSSRCHPISAAQARSGSGGASPLGVGAGGGLAAAGRSSSGVGAAGSAAGAPAPCTQSSGAEERTGAVSGAATIAETEPERSRGQRSDTSQVVAPPAIRARIDARASRSTSSDGAEAISAAGALAAASFAAPAARSDAVGSG
jgi:hypothetical protein